MQNLPEVGKTYVSQADPTLTVYIESVEIIEADEDIEAGYMVTACNPKDVKDMGGMGYEFFNDEWTSFQFKPL